MSFVASAIASAVGGGGLSVGGLTSGISGGGGASSLVSGATQLIGPATELYTNKLATDAATDASKLASQTELEMYYQSREDTAPWREAGENALGRLDEKIAAGPGEFDPQKDPGYEFGYKEFVEKPFVRGGASRGFGGKFGKELSRYSQDYASSKYDNFLDRWYQSLTPDQSMAGVGQTTAERGADRSMQTGQSIGQNQLSAGGARATGYQNIGSTVSNVASGLGQNALDLYYMNKTQPAATSGNALAPAQVTPNVTPNVSIT